MKAKLVVVGGDVKAKEVNLSLPTVIGRGRNVTLTLPHALVSRRHCEIYEKSGRLRVRDLGSLNGTFVNNEQITTDHALEPGQLLTIGAVTFRAVYQDMENSSDSFSADVLTNKETVAQSDSDTGRINLPQADEVEAIPDAIADKKTVPAPASKPRSNPRPFRQESTPLPVANVLDGTPFDNKQTIQDIHRQGEIPGGIAASGQLPTQPAVNPNFVDKVVFEEPRNNPREID